MKKLLSVLFCLMMIGMTVLPAFAEGQQTITEVRLSITQPAVCEAPDMTIESAEPDKYNAKVRYWIKQMLQMSRSKLLKPDMSTLWF